MDIFQLAIYIRRRTMDIHCLTIEPNHCAIQVNQGLLDQRAKSIDLRLPWLQIQGKSLVSPEVADINWGKSGCNA